MKGPYNQQFLMNWKHLSLIILTQMITLRRGMSLREESTSNLSSMFSSDSLSICRCKSWFLANNCWNSEVGTVASWEIRRRKSSQLTKLVKVGL